MGQAHWTSASAAEGAHLKKRNAEGAFVRIGIFLMLAAMLMLGVQSDSATAQAMADSGMGGFATFSDKDNQLLALGPGATGKGHKDAALLIENATDDKSPQMALFPDSAAWAKFAEIWNTAQETPTPIKGSQGRSIASFTVYGGGSLFTVFKYDDGTIVFAMVPNSFDQRVFILDPSLFAAFNRKVIQISKTISPTP